MWTSRSAWRLMGLLESLGDVHTYPPCEGGWGMSRPHGIAYPVEHPPNPLRKGEKAEQKPRPSQAAAFLLSKVKFLI